MISSASEQSVYYYQSQAESSSTSPTECALARDDDRMLSDIDDEKTPESEKVPTGTDSEGDGKFLFIHQKLW